MSKHPHLAVVAAVLTALLGSNVAVHGPAGRSEGVG
jgi:hypothetical protein